MKGSPMASNDKVRTTHTGSLPRPAELFAAMTATSKGVTIATPSYEAALKRHVPDIVKMQVDAGIDVVNDGEYSKPSFMNYIAERLAGFEARMPPGGMPVPTGPMGVDGRDSNMFPDFYKQVLEHNPFANVIRVPPHVCVGPIKYVGQEKVKRDIANLKSAMAAAGAKEAFLPAAAPIPFFQNEHYKSEEEFILAFGDAMREEYQAILDAGFALQIDFPRLVSHWDDRKTLTLPDYRKWMENRIAHLNHALRGLPEERIRFHTCYGVNFGPRVSDLQLADVVDLIFTIKAGAYSFEAGNPRHEHEWRLFEKVKLPAGKKLIPGAVTHSNVMIEHPEAVADRMERWINVAGAGNVMFGNDCGFQSTAGNTEIPVSVAEAKLKSLGEGARIASKRLG
jgi:5-methyltetrahydropteroyltriglutamate--homocysteine methyltransferase